MGYAMRFLCFRKSEPIFSTILSYICVYPVNLRLDFFKCRRPDVGSGSKPVFPASPLRIRLDRVAGADEVAVAVDLVDAGDGRPELVDAEIGQREGRRASRPKIPEQIQKARLSPASTLRWSGASLRHPDLPMKAIDSGGTGEEND